MKRILVTHTGGWIGDMVLMGPALRALKRAHPDAQVTAHVRPQVAALMRRNPHVDEVLPDEGLRGVRGALRWRKTVRRGRFDAAIVWHPTSMRAAFLTWLAGIPIRVGHRIAGRGLFLTRSLPNSLEHETRRYLRVLKLLDVSDDLLADDVTAFWHGDAERAFAAEFSSEDDAPLVGVNLGTTWPTKAWEPSRFAEVARRLVADGSRVLITGSADERAAAEAFGAAMGETSYLNAVGECDIFQTAALIERCDAYLTADSGPMHIAAAVGTPTVAVFGPTSPARHGPVGDGHVTLQEPLDCAPCYKRTCRLREQFLCMKSVDAERATAALKAVLDAR